MSANVKDDNSSDMLIDLGDQHDNSSDMLIDLGDNAPKIAEENAKQEAEENAKQEAEENAKQEAEEKAKQEAEEKAKQEAEDISDMLDDLGDFGGNIEDLVGVMSDSYSYDILRGMSAQSEELKKSPDPVPTHDFFLPRLATADETPAIPKSRFSERPKVRKFTNNKTTRDQIAPATEDGILPPLLGTLCRSNRRSCMISEPCGVCLLCTEKKCPELSKNTRKRKETSGEVESEPTNPFREYRTYLENERVKAVEKAAQALSPYTIRQSLLKKIAELPTTPRDGSVSSKPEAAKSLCVILITTHGRLNAPPPPVEQTRRNDLYDLFKTVDSTVFTSNAANIVKVTAAAAGSVNYTRNSEIQAWKVHIETWMEQWCQPGDPPQACEQFAADTKAAAAIISRSYKAALDAPTESIWLDADSLLSVNASSLAHKDLAEYYRTNYLNGFGSIRIHPGKQPLKPLLEKTYSKGVGTPTDLTGELYLGNIEIYCCGKKEWVHLFPDDDDNKTTSDIINAIKNYSEVVILDYSCTVFDEETEKKSLPDKIRSIIVRMDIGGGKNKSKKRKRKSNKTRKRRRMPSKRKKHKKHKKSKKPKTKRNPNKRKTKRK
jgi:hypothetical protein